MKDLSQIEIEKILKENESLKNSKKYLLYEIKKLGEDKLLLMNYILFLERNDFTPKG